MHVHHVADDHRRTFVPAQHAGRERPGDLQVTDVVLVDLVERGEAGVGVVLRGRHPLGVVLLQLDELVIGQSR
jgi:hypothetical protein